ncbi:MAG: hypothetical protein HY074_02515, partial [Deltaproteobacteria bacterium]|nr:hypothetical protein [Deltaproteobacteria bacterium]
MPQILVWLVSILARGSKEVEALSAPHVVRRRWYLFVAVVLTLLLPFTYALSHTMMGWLNLSAVVELPHALWKVAYGFPSTTCGLNATSTPSCLANPDNSQLWQSRWHRGDQVAHSNRLKENLSAEYWLGVEINADQQKTAYEHEANFLVLGNLRSTFRIWVDGLQIMHGTYRDNEPTAVQLPLEWLARGKPMRIAINMVPEPGVGGNDTDVPDYLEEPPILGLSTKAGTTGWREHQYFWLMARPMAFLVLNFILGWIFFGLWRVAPEKTEYFYIALFAITFALFQMRSLGLFYLALPRKFITTMGAIVAIFNSVVGMLVGFSFARFRRELM